MTARRFWIVLAGAALLVPLYFALRGGGDKKKAPDAPRPVPVLTARVDKTDVPLWLEGLGSVAAFQQVLVRPQIDGRLDKVFFKEMQDVKKGQLLAQIDPRPFEIMKANAEGALARDQATLVDAKINLDRYVALRKDNLVGQQQVDDQRALVGQSEGAIRVDEAQIANAKLQLDYARIVSPIEGVVGVRLVDAGNLIHASDATGIVIVTQLDPAAVFITLPEDALPDVAAAMARGAVTVEAYTRDGGSLLGKGTLIAIDNQINDQTATLRLKALIPNPKRTLWPKQFVKARILVDSAKDAIVVAAQAVQRGPQGPFVYTLINGKADPAKPDAKPERIADPRPVKIGRQAGDVIIVDKGLEVGEEIVIEGQSQLRAGSKVEVRVPKTPTAER